MPRTANPEIKETLLRASLRCFARNGYQATSLDMIAREAHVTKGAIYWYYKDKAELFENVLQDRVAHLESLVGERLSEKMPPDERLQTLLQTVLDFYSENPDFASLLGILRSGPDSALGPCGANEVAAYYRTVRNDFALMLQQGMEQGVFVQGDPATLAVWTLAFLDGVILQWALDPQEVSIQKLSAALVAQVMRGLCKERG